MSHTLTPVDQASSLKTPTLGPEKYDWTMEHREGVASSDETQYTCQHVAVARASMASR